MVSGLPSLVWMMLWGPESYIPERLWIVLCIAQPLQFISKTGICPLEPPRDPWSFGVINNRMYSVEYSGASQSSHTYIEITWDTPVICMIILKVTGKLLLPMYSDLVVPEAYTYPNGFLVSLSAFLPDHTGVAALILVTAVRPCHIHPPPLVPLLTSSEYPLLEVLFLVIHPIVMFV